MSSSVSSDPSELNSITNEFDESGSDDKGSTGEPSASEFGSGSSDKSPAGGTSPSKESTSSSTSGSTSGSTSSSTSSSNVDSGERLPGAAEDEVLGMKLYPCVDLPDLGRGRVG